MRKELLRLAWPIIIQNILMITTLIVDTIMLGYYSQTSQAAAGLSTPINLSVRLVLMCIPITATAMVARAIGENNREKASSNAAMALLVGLMLGGIVSLAGVAGAKLLVSFFVPINEPLGQEAVIYLTITVSAFGLSYIFLIGTAILRGSGNTKTALFISIFSNLLNVAGNYLLIYGKSGFPEWGIKGAAIATAAAWTTECALMLLVLFLGNSGLALRIKHFRQITVKMISTLLRISLPAAIEPLITQAFGSMVFLKIVTIFGTTALATHHILLRIEGFSFMPAMALSMAAGALFGQVLGACQIEKTQSIRKEALFFTLIIMGTMGVLFMVFRQYIISGFSPDISIRQLGVQCLIIAALEQPLMGYAMVHIGILRGAGDTKSTLYVNVIGALFIRLPLAYLLAVTLNLGLLGIWMTMPVDWLVRCIIYYFIYRTGHWKRINI